MKLSKMLAAIVLVICFSASSVFAAPAASPSAGQEKPNSVTDSLKKEDKNFKCKKHKWDKAKMEEFEKDPVNALEKRKTEVKALLKEGKLTQEKADAITKRLDSDIKSIKEFNKLSLKEKKEKLLGNFKAHLEEKVKDGRITREKADIINKKYNEKVENWDGKGFPHFVFRGIR